MSDLLQRPHTLAALLAAAMLSLSFAPTAVAQNAGDDQYADPFGQAPEDQGGDQGSGEQPSPQSSPQPAPTPEPQAAPVPEPAPAPTVEGQDGVAAEPDTSQQLPRTGVPVGLIAAMGAVLFGLGMALMRRTHQPAAADAGVADPRA